MSVSLRTHRQRSTLSSSFTDPSRIITEFFVSQRNIITSIALTALLYLLTFSVVDAAQSPPAATATLHAKTYSLHLERRRYFEAKADCEARTMTGYRPGKLPVVQSSEENSAILSLANTRNHGFGVWLGGTDFGHSLSWRHSDHSTDEYEFYIQGTSTSVFYTNWNTGRPSINNHYIAMESNGKWTDYTECQRHVYVCEFEALPVAAATLYAFELLHADTSYTKAGTLCSFRKYKGTTGFRPILKTASHWDTLKQLVIDFDYDDNVWLGASKPISNQWRWDDGTVFWNGDAGGTCVGGLVCRWDTNNGGQPNNIGGNQDRAVMYGTGSGSSLGLSNDVSSSSNYRVACAYSVSGTTAAPAGVTPAMTNVPPVPPSTRRTVANKLFEAFQVGIAQSAAQAERTCNAQIVQGQSGYLATIFNQEENEAVYRVKQAASCAGNAWIGGSDSATEGTFRWIQRAGKPTFWLASSTQTADIGYANWASGQPDNSGNQDSVVMSSSGAWDDRGELSGLTCFICEWTIPTEGSRQRAYWTRNDYTGVSYSVARTLCESSTLANSTRGHLPVIRIADDQTELNDIVRLSNTPGFWTSAEKVAATGKWYWRGRVALPLYDGSACTQPSLYCIPLVTPLGSSTRLLATTTYSSSPVNKWVASQTFDTCSGGQYYPFVCQYDGTATPTMTLSKSPTATKTFSTTRSSSPSPSGSRTGTSQSTSQSQSSTVSLSRSASLSPTPSSSGTPSPTSTPTPSQTGTQSPTSSTTHSPSMSGSISSSPSSSHSTSSSSSNTGTPTPSVSQSVSGTASWSSLRTPSLSLSSSSTEDSSQSESSSQSLTITPTGSTTVTISKRSLTLSLSSSVLSPSISESHTAPSSLSETVTRSVHSPSASQSRSTPVSESVSSSGPSLSISRSESGPTPYVRIALDPPRVWLSQVVAAETVNATTTTGSSTFTNVTTATHFKIRAFVISDHDNWAKNLTRSTCLDLAKGAHLKPLMSGNGTHLEGQFPSPEAAASWSQGDYFHSFVGSIRIRYLGEVPLTESMMKTLANNASNTSSSVDDSSSNIAEQIFFARAIEISIPRVVPPNAQLRDSISFIEDDDVATVDTNVTIFGTYLELHLMPRCFARGSWPLQPLRLQIAADPIPPNNDLTPLQQGTDIATVIAGAVGSPGNAMALQRINLIGAFCAEFEVEPLDWLDSPTGVAFTENRTRYHFGAIIMNPILVIALMLITVIAACIYRAVTKKPLHTSFVATRTVHLQLFGFVLMIQPTVGSCVIAMIYAFDAGIIFAASFVTLLFAGSASFVTVYFLKRHFHAKFVEKDAAQKLDGASSTSEQSAITARKGQQDSKTCKDRLPPCMLRVYVWFKWFTTPMGDWEHVPPSGDKGSSFLFRWLTTIDDYPKLFDPLFLDYRAPYQRFIGVEFICSVALCTSSSLATGIGCQIGSPLLLLSCLLYFIAIWKFRPHAAPIDKAFSMTISLLQLLAAIAQILLAFMTKSDGVREGLDWILIILSILAMIHSVYDLAKMFKRIAHSATKDKPIKTDDKTSSAITMQFNQESTLLTVHELEEIADEVAPPTARNSPIPQPCHHAPIDLDFLDAHDHYVPPTRHLDILDDDEELLQLLAAREDGLLVVVGQSGAGGGTDQFAAWRRQREIETGVRDSNGEEIKQRPSTVISEAQRLLNELIGSDDEGEEEEMEEEGGQGGEEEEEQEEQEEEEGGKVIDAEDDRVELDDDLADNASVFLEVPEKAAFDAPFRLASPLARLPATSQRENAAATQPHQRQTVTTSVTARATNIHLIDDAFLDTDEDEGQEEVDDVLAGLLAPNNNRNNNTQPKKYGFDPNSLL